MRSLQKQDGNPGPSQTIYASWQRASRGFAGSLQRLSSRTMTSITAQLRALGIDPARCTIGPSVGDLLPPAGNAAGKPEADIAPAGAGRSPGDRMNKTERLFSWELEDQRTQGAIDWWAFEPLTLVIVDAAGLRCRYTPDFVTACRGRIQCIEIKGFLREAARIRFLAARERYPFFTFQMIRRVQGGWEELL